MDKTPSVPPSLPGTTWECGTPGTIGSLYCHCFCPHTYHQWCCLPRTLHRSTRGPAALLPYGQLHMYWLQARTSPTVMPLHFTGNRQPLHTDNGAPYIYFFNMALERFGTRWHTGNDMAAAATRWRNAWRNVAAMSLPLSRLAATRTLSLGALPLASHISTDMDRATATDFAPRAG